MKRPFHRVRYLSCAAQRAFAALLSAEILFASVTSYGDFDDTWTGGGSGSNWSTSGNWSGNNVPGVSYGAGNTQFGTLYFNDNNNGKTTLTDDIATLSENSLKWYDTSSWQINSSNGAVINLYSQGGNNNTNQSKIENNSTGTVALNVSITFADTNGANRWGEINAVSGNLLFGSGYTLTVNGSNVDGIRMYSGLGRTTTFNGTVSASGKYFDTASSSAQTINIFGSFTSGNFFLMNGSTLNITSAGSVFAASNLRLGGDFTTSGNQDLTKGATFNLTVATGGLTYAGGINSVTGNTSNALVINSQNISNSNTLSGGFFLDSNLTINQSGAGGTLLLGAASSANTISFQSVGSRTLTLNAGGSSASAITVNESFSNVLNGSDMLIVTGAGTTTIASDNSTSGANLLKFNIQGGNLEISAANNLGSPAVTGSGYPDKVVFGGTSGATTSTLIVNGTFSYGSTTAGQILGFAINQSTSANTAVINVTGSNVFTLNGALTDTGSGTVGNFQKTGTGTLYLANSANSYSGTTTISAGILAVNSLATVGNSSIGNSTGSNANNLIIDGGTLQYRGAGESTSRLFTVGANGATIDSSGTGAITFNAGVEIFSGTGNRNFVLAGSNTGNNTFTPAITDPATGSTSLVKNGTGRWTVGGTQSNYTGTTTINGGILAVDNNTGASQARLPNTTGITVNSGGTLLLYQSGATTSTNRINDSATIALVGGTFNLGGKSEGAAGSSGIGQLTLSATSTLDFGTTGTSNLIQFAGVTHTAGNGTLNILEWEGIAGGVAGNDHLYFAGLVTTFQGEFNQSDVIFNGITGYGATQFAGYYEVYGLVAVPEPTTWAAGILALGTLGFSQRRRVRRWLGVGRRQESQLALAA